MLEQVGAVERRIANNLKKSWNKVRKVLKLPIYLFLYDVICKDFT